MTTSVISGPLVGAQRPRVEHVPQYASTTGPEAIELAAAAGLVLDDWQQHVLTESLGEREDGLWAAREIGLMVSRQNGKGALLEARELAGLFLLEEDLIVHSAQQFDTASAHFRRLTRRIEDTPQLARRIASRGGILRGHGNESITLSRNPETGKQPRLEIRTRTGTGGLGFSINCLIFDEAMIISDEMHQALLPTLSAMPNIQVWYTGSAVDEENPSHQGVPFARIREKGMAKSPAMAYFEWSLPHDDPAKVTEVTDEEIASVNPGLGIRLDLDYIREMEQSSLSARGLAIQRYGVGRWPRTDGLDGVVITPEQWGKCWDRESKIAGDMCFSLDVSPDRAFSSICVAGFREDGLAHVEVIRHKRGPSWVVESVAELVEKHKPLAVLLDGLSGAFALLPELNELLKEKDGLGGLHEQEVTVLGSREHAQACGMFYDAVDQQTMRHIGQPEVSEALLGAVKRDMSDAWAWSRKNSTVDITPLVGCTIALFGALTMRFPEPQFWNLDEFS